LQGERELAKDCRSLARFDLKGIPPMAAGLPRIEVKLLIDANGILNVSAREQRSGREAEIEVKPTYGLTDDQVESMILDSFDHAEDDFRERQMIEARNEAETMLSALEKSKRNPAWAMLSAEEKQRIDELEHKLADVKCPQHNAADYKAIQAATEALNKATTRLAELMMDSAVSSALHGQTMEGAGEKIGEGPTAPHPIAPAEFSKR
jgi:molecular chaperone DnaK (HSP70)